MKSLRNLPIVAIFLTIFVDLVGISIVIPVAAPLFLGTHGGLFDPQMSAQARIIILGILLAVAPCVQFFSAPLLGAYSDRVGRKPVLLFSILAVGLGHLMFGMAVLTHHLWLMFISRFLAGAGAGNLSTANSVMADMSDPGSKARNFGLVGTAVGMGIIFGPFLGGKLSDPSIVHWFNYGTPLWCAAFLSFLNILFIALVLPETLKQRIDRPMDPFTGIRGLAQAFRTPNLRTLYLTSFLFSFGFNFFTQFFSVFLVARFGFSTGQIGNLVAYVGIWLAFTQGVLTRILSRHIPSQQIIRYAPLVAVTTLLVLARVQHVTTTYWLLPVVALSYGVNPPNVTALISNSADRRSQGEVLGLNESMSALAFGLPPILAAIAITVSAAAPLILAAMGIFAAWSVFMRYHSTRAPLFHEE